MAVILQMTYQKKLGLPNYSSHSCAVSLTVEIADASAAAQKTGELYQLLQTAVDGEIQQVGFMPDATTYGMNNGSRPSSNGQPRQDRTHPRRMAGTHRHRFGHIHHLSSGTTQHR